MFVVFVFIFVLKNKKRGTIGQKLMKCITNEINSAVILPVTVDYITFKFRFLVKQSKVVFFASFVV